MRIPTGVAVVAALVLVASVSTTGSAHHSFATEFDGSLGVVIYPLQRRLCMDLNLMERVPADVYGVKLLVEGEPKLWFRPWQLRKLGSGEQPQSKRSTKTRDRELIEQLE